MCGLDSAGSKNRTTRGKTPDQFMNRRGSHSTAKVRDDIDLQTSDLQHLNTVYSHNDRNQQNLHMTTKEVQPPSWHTTAVIGTVVCVRGLQWFLRAFVKIARSISETVRK